MEAAEVDWAARDNTRLPNLKRRIGIPLVISNEFN